VGMRKSSESENGMSEPDILCQCSCLLSKCLMCTLSLFVPPPPHGHADQACGHLRQQHVSGADVCGLVSRCPGVSVCA